jgi:hypothetical protein
MQCSFEKNLFDTCLWASSSDDVADFPAKPAATATSASDGSAFEILAGWEQLKELVKAVSEKGSAPEALAEAGETAKRVGQSEEGGGKQVQALEQRIKQIQTEIQSGDFSNAPDLPKLSGELAAAKASPIEEEVATEQFELAFAEQFELAHKRRKFGTGGGVGLAKCMSQCRMTEACHFFAYNENYEDICLLLGNFDEHDFKQHCDSAFQQYSTENSDVLLKSSADLKEAMGNAQIDTMAMLSNFYIYMIYDSHFTLYGTDHAIEGQCKCKEGYTKIDDFTCAVPDTTPHCTEVVVTGPGTIDYDAANSLGLEAVLAAAYRGKR